MDNQKLYDQICNSVIVLRTNSGSIDSFSKDSNFFVKNFEDIFESKKLIIYKINTLNTIEFYDKNF